MWLFTVYIAIAAAAALWTSATRGTHSIAASSLLPSFHPLLVTTYLVKYHKIFIIPLAHSNTLLFLSLLLLSVTAALCEDVTNFSTFVVFKLTWRCVRHVCTLIKYKKRKHKATLPLNSDPSTPLLWIAETTGDSAVPAPKPFQLTEPIQVTSSYLFWVCRCGGCRRILCHPRLVADNNSLSENPLEKSRSSALTWQQLNKTLHRGADEWYKRSLQRQLATYFFRPSFHFQMSPTLYIMRRARSSSPSLCAPLLWTFISFQKKVNKKRMKGTSELTAVLWQAQGMQKTEVSKTHAGIRTPKACRCDNWHQNEATRAVSN